MYQFIDKSCLPLHGYIFTIQLCISQSTVLQGSREDNDLSHSALIQETLQRKSN